MSHIIPLYLALASEIPTPASFLRPLENHHNITKHAEPIPSRPRYGAAMLLFSFVLFGLVAASSVEVLRTGEV